MPPEQRTTAGQAKSSDHRPNAKGSPTEREQNEQNEQNSKLTDGAYFLFDGYPSRSVVMGEPLEYFLGCARQRAGL